jgi:hypothetical protein
MSTIGSQGIRGFSPPRLSNQEAKNRRNRAFKYQGFGGLRKPIINYRNRVSRGLNPIISRGLNPIISRGLNPIISRGLNMLKKPINYNYRNRVSTMVEPRKNLRVPQNQNVKKVQQLVEAGVLKPFYKQKVNSGTTLNSIMKDKMINWKQRLGMNNNQLRN